jgi:hypothetical protein
MLPVVFSAKVDQTANVNNCCLLFMDGSEELLVLVQDLFLWD